MHTHTHTQTQYSSRYMCLVPKGNAFPSVFDVNFTSRFDTNFMRSNVPSVRWLDDLLYACCIFYWKNQRNYVVEKTDVHIENGKYAKVTRLLCGYLVIGIFSLIQWLGQSQSRSSMQFSWDRWQFESITIATIKVTIVLIFFFLSIANAPHFDQFSWAKKT